MTMEIFQTGSRSITAGSEHGEPERLEVADSNTRLGFSEHKYSPNQYMVIFASSKNRRVRAAIHTNSKSAPSRPKPVSLRPDLSSRPNTIRRSRLRIFRTNSDHYHTLTLVSTGANARFTVPTSDSIGTT